MRATSLPNSANRVNLSSECADPSPEAEFPLSFTQESLWFVDQVAPGTPAYNIPAAWRLRGPLDLGKLQFALDRLVERHEALRTLFRAQDGKPIQIVMPPRPFALQMTDFGGRAFLDLESELRKTLAAEAARPFDLRQGPLARAVVYRLGDQEHVLFLNFHHLIADEWSLGVFLKELAELYDAGVSGGSRVLPELPIQYADFAVWQRENASSHFAAELAYWKKQLGGPLPRVALAGSERKRPATTPFAGETDFSVIDPQLSGILKQLSREEGVTLFMTLAAGFKALLHRYTRQTDVLIGSPMANRGQVETEGLVGMFVNMHALRTDLSGDPTFKELLGRVRDVVLGAYAHQSVPTDKVIEALNPVREPGRHPLFQIVFGLQPAANEGWSLAGCDATPIELDNGASKFDWTLLLTESPEGLRVRSEYSTTALSKSVSAQLLKHFESLLRDAATNPLKRISELSLIDAAERALLLGPAPGTEVESAADECVQDIFEVTAGQFAARTAVSMGGERLTYAELNAQANSLAHYLRQRGVGRDKIVALCLERSPRMIVAILGVLKAGAAYLPIDPSSPPERTQFMLGDSAAVILLTQEHLRGRANGFSGTILCIDSDWDKIAARPTANPAPANKPEDIAYIIYTSGSTGRPKGVLVSHRNVVRLFRQTDPWFKFNESDVWTLFHSYTFDFSVWEIWGALLYGGRLVVVSHLMARAPDEFYRLLATEKVTVLNQTPSAFRQLIWAETTAAQTRDLQIRYIICGGEALELQSLKPWFKRHGDERPRIVNMYGITETTVHVTYRVIREADVAENLGSVIGVPIPDLRTYLLDEHLEPVPAGVPGEICVSGAGVARGYLNRPELDALRFVPDPFTHGSPERMYRSGDLAVRTWTGELEYLGRIDQQVKIRGFRIELGEIESALNSHPAIRESVVLAEDCVGGEKRLLAYFVPAGSCPSTAELRQHVAQRLPEYMVPGWFVPLTSLPLTVNGKVDRKALPAPEVSAEQSAASGTPPGTELEKLVARVWSELLGRPELTLEANFFQCGGHSLLGTQAISRLAAALGIELSVRILFEAPTLRELAVALEQAKAEQAGQKPLPSASWDAQRATEVLGRIDRLSDAEIERLLADLESKPVLK